MSDTTFFGSLCTVVHAFLLAENAFMTTTWQTVEIFPLCNSCPNLLEMLLVYMLSELLPPRGEDNSCIDTVAQFSFKK